MEEKNVGWVRIGDVTNSSKYLYETKDYFSNDGIKKSRFLPKGSLIMSICATIGKPVITGIDTCIHDGFVGFTNLNSVNKEFLYYLLNILEPKFSSLSQTGSQANLNSDLVRITKVGVPTYEEQTKIVSFLTTVDKKINLLYKKQDYLKDFKKFCLQNLFIGKLRFKEFDNYLEIVNLGDFLNESVKKSVINNQYPIISSTNKGIFLQNEYFNDRNVASKNNKGYKILLLNQLVLSPQNLWMGNININDKFDIGIVSPSYKVYNINENIILVDYLKFIIKIPRMLYEYEISSEQGASIVRRNLNKSLFNEISLKIPSIAEQEKIADFLSLIDKKLDLTQNQITEMENFKKGLLQQMFVYLCIFFNRFISLF